MRNFSPCANICRKLGHFFAQIERPGCCAMQVRGSRGQACQVHLRLARQLFSSSQMFEGKRVEDETGRRWRFTQKHDTCLNRFFDSSAI